MEIIFRDDKGDPAKLAAREPRSTRQKFANPVRRRRSRGFIDDVIMPHETRQAHLPLAGDAARTRSSRIPWRKHGNIPL